MAAPAEVRLRRTWPQRLLIAFNVVLILLCLTGAGGLGYFYYKFGNLERVPLAKGILTPEEPPGEPQNFLLVGSDSRAFVENEADRESFGTETNTGGQRADTIILVRVDPRSKHAAMVSFPRDLWVPIAPDGDHNRINTAFTNGPQQLIETIKTDFNIPIHHYAQVDFKGFQGLVDAVGGVVVYLASPVRDRVTGLHVVKTGCVELGGGQALAYVRSRHFQYQEDGRWKTDPRGDLGRIERQQDFIRRALREALSKGLTNPARLNRLVNVGLKNVQVSKSLDLRDIVNLGKNFRSLAPDTLSQYSLPVTSGRTSAGASVLRIEDDDQDEAERIFDVFRGTPPASSQPVEPSAVSLRVLNGSGIGGQAGEASSALQQHQFTVGTPGNTSQVSRTTIRYGSGQEAKAHLLARYLVSGADIVGSSSLRSVDLELVTGSDFEGVRATPLPATATTVTITPPTTTPPPAAPPC
jgi:LCP family protein required for cell wall assembly